MADLDPVQVLAIYAMIKARHREKAALEDLRVKINAERRRQEWARSIRTRNYITVECV
ncbi:hypothetical protein V7S43_013208 [Phytophthora oleae]|uniref:Uncharacterized protein n=1 Tax=Phytophthora oleae TaxID=2107226 RepID=A0ABD3F8Y0_9STRA